MQIAIVGSGPAGFYSLQSLLSKDPPGLRVDLFERLPAPFGLLRYGVAPDHPKIKSVTAVFERLARDPRVRLFGGVEFGRDLTIDDLAHHYDHAVICTGAESDRRLNIPGEDLRRSHSATEFVAWYNGHPDFADRVFDLDQERALVVGVGNVAADVARILCRTTEDLARTDIADHALEALSRSRVREVVVVGRRGPVQAAFSNPEMEELLALAGVEVVVDPNDLVLDARDLAAAAADRSVARRIELLQGAARRTPGAGLKRLTLRFLTSPVEIYDDGHGGVGAVRLVRNELVVGDDGTVRARATDRAETLDVGLVFRSVGYRGVPLPGVPFDDREGRVPNDAGRVLDRATGAPIPGLYVSGWIKRGPQGVIGTNKPDAAETIAQLVADHAAGIDFGPRDRDPDAVVRLLTGRGVRPVTRDDWDRLDALEVERGRANGRPRVKLVRREEFARALAT